MPKEPKPKKAKKEEVFVATQRVFTSKGIAEQGERLELPTEEVEAMVKQNLARKL